MISFSHFMVPPVVEFSEMAGCVLIHSVVIVIIIAIIIRRRKFITRT